MTAASTARTRASRQRGRATPACDIPPIPPAVVLGPGAPPGSPCRPLLRTPPTGPVQGGSGLWKPRTPSRPSCHSWQVTRGYAVRRAPIALTVLALLVGLSGCGDRASEDELVKA